MVDGYKMAATIGSLAAENTRLRADVARLTAALAVHREALDFMYEQADDCCGTFGHTKECLVGRALADPDGTAALAMVRGLERGLSAATENVTIAIARAEKAERDLTTLRREVRRTGRLTGNLAKLLPERRVRDEGRVDGDRREVVS